MSRFHPLRIARVERPTRDALAVVFDVPAELRDAYRFNAGQHLTLRADIDGTEVRRSYSICSAVGDPAPRIAIKRVPGGLFSNWAQDHLAAGLLIDTLPPAGHFGMPPSAEHARHYIAFAAGSGITPILSIIKTTLALEPGSRVTLVYGNRASGTVLFKEELIDLKDRYLGRFNLVFVLSRERQDMELFNGRIDADKVTALLASWINPEDLDLAYVCGPLGMMEAVRDALLGHGFAPEQIRVELFATSAAGPRAGVRTAARPHPGAGTDVCEVSVVQDGRTAFFSMQKGAESILEAALAQGIELPYSCKAGVCSTCRCKRLAGELDMDANFALEDYELERGFVLACQSYPVSDQLVLDFDCET